MDLTGKNVLVFGTGLSGASAFWLLKDLGAFPVLFDGNENSNREEICRKCAADAREVFLGTLPAEIIGQLDLVVLSPGVPTDLPLVCQFRARGIPIWGEVELAYRVAKGDLLAITGTNGKTTTTSLLGEILSRARASVFVVGNIGVPYTQIAKKTRDDSVTVAEISSFQLETTEAFHPKISAILNVTPDHLDRHHTMEAYLRAKERICENQAGGDVCVLNYEDLALRAFAGQISCKPLFFSSARPLEEGIFLQGEEILYKNNGETHAICHTRELRLLGRHNYENVMAASAMALSYGVSHAHLRESLLRFSAVEHRIEFVAEIDGVAYYNDSKGTNPDAAIKGIEAMERPTYLIGGGYDKDASYGEWIRAFGGKVRALVLIGQTKEKIAREARACGFAHCVLAESLKEAFDYCADHAAPGDAVLLSPACASWDMFSNYEERGRAFQDLVRQREKKAARVSP